MAAAARMKQTQKQRISGCRCNSLTRLRRFLWAAFLVVVIGGFVASHELMYFHLRRPLRLWTRAPPPLTNETLLAYAKLKPDGFDERDKIRYLLEKTDSGRISIRDVVYPHSTTVSRISSARSGLGTGFASGRSVAARRSRSVSGTPSSRVMLSEKAWMLPLTSKRLVPYLPKFIQLAKRWLGHSDYDAKVMEKLVETVKKPMDENLAYWSSRGNSSGDKRAQEIRDRYESCAVVGNSGILLNGSYGEQIDSHEMVIRLNNAEIAKWKSHVGSKTTISFMNSNVFRLCSVRPNCWCHQYGDEVPIVMYISQPQHLMLAAVCGAFHKSPLLVTPSLLDILCARIVKWYSMKNFISVTGRGIDEWDAVHHSIYFHYSSGMQAIVLALGICDRVNIYGFGKSVHVKHHYHTNQTKELSLHDYAAEYIFYDDLVNQRTIPFLGDAGFSIPRVQIFY